VASRPNKHSTGAVLFNGDVSEGKKHGNERERESERAREREREMMMMGQGLRKWRVV
jgi:hypothetical protein